jgi:hypothetical protein
MASMARRIKELEEQLGTALPSGHRHTSSTCSDRRHRGSERSTGGDQYMEQVVDSEDFLTAVSR